MTDGIKDIKGVDTNPRKKEPYRPGHAEMAGGHVQTILEHTRGDGSTGHGINPANVHTPGDRSYNGAAGRTHRADLRETPHPDSKR